MPIRMTQHGNFDPPLKQLAIDELLTEFSESFDFARCQRPDGSFYGISEGLQCRKGTKAASGEKYEPKRKKSSAPSDTARRMAVAYERLQQEKARRVSEKEPAKAIKQNKPEAKKKKEEAIKPIEKAKSQKPKSEKASGEEIKSETKKRLSKLSPEKLNQLSKMKLTPAQKIAVEEVKTKVKTEGVTQSAKESADSKSKEALALIKSTEKRLQANLASAQKEFEKTRSDDADDRMYTIRADLKRIAADRKAIEGGIFSKPEPKQLTDAQRQRLNDQIETLKPKLTGYADKDYDRYSRLLNMSRAKDPAAMAEAIRNEIRARQELSKLEKKDQELYAKGATWEQRQPLRNQTEQIRKRITDAKDSIELAQLDRNERFSKYIMSKGMISLLDTDSDVRQNGAHKNSSSIFAEHGELGSSKQAQALVKKFGGDRQEVQRGIDSIIDFTQNNYRAIRRAVEQPGSDDYRATQAKRIDTMLSKMDHPDVTKFRGINLPETALEGLISASKSSSSFSDPAPSSWSTSALISSGYAGQSKGGKAAVIFETKNKTGASVENFGQSGEKEILTPGNTKYKHTGYRVETHEGLPIHIFTVEEL